MQTEILKLTGAEDDAPKISRAAELLRAGEVVAIPTETVYGLAANALDACAVKKIFEAKGRPQDNPLIVHISDVREIEDLCEDIPPAAYALAEAFWPGPLTIVMKKKACIPDTVSAGLDTVGIRCPEAVFARRIIRSAGVPLAAPSANTSGKPSPTLAEHVVQDMRGKIPAIVDGGECRVGVESTVVDVTTVPAALLRPGGVTAAQLREVLGEITVDRGVTQQFKAHEKARSPGMKYRHYAPHAPVIIIKGDTQRVHGYLAEQARNKKVAYLCYGTESRESLPEGVMLQVYGMSDDAADLAHGVFDALRRLDMQDVDVIYARVPEQGDGIEQAVINRLEKASGFTEIVL